jgi:hypothetical protein
MSQDVDEVLSKAHTVAHKVARSTLLPGVSVSLNARPPASYDVVIYSPAGEQPVELFSGLRAIGFGPRGPVEQSAAGERQKFGREGSALLGGWTRPERERFIGDARRTLRRFGFVLVPEIPYVAGAAQ